VVVNRFREVERAVQKNSVRLTVLRAGKEQVVDVPTVVLGGRDLDRILVWAGAVLQKPHRALSAQRGIAPEGVFVAYFSYGSPATRYQLWAGRRIVEVDGQPISDLDAFVKAVSGREDRSSLRLRTVSWNGSVEVITLKLDQRFWPDVRAAPDGSGLEAGLAAITQVVARTRRPGSTPGLVIIPVMAIGRVLQEEIQEAVEALRAGELVAFRRKPSTASARTPTIPTPSARSSAPRTARRRTP
jgi:hypothetical protein